MPSARDCALLFLQTIPTVMRNLRGPIRQGKSSDDDKLTMEQFRLLGMLHHKAWTLGELASRHHVAPSTMSRSIDVLVQRHWVTRQNDTDDRRQVSVRLTDEGQQAHQTFVGHMEDAVTQLVAQLDQDDLGKLYDGLQVLHKLLDRTQQCGEPEATP